MSKALTEVQIAEIKEIFALFDKNSDGLVASSELGTILRALAHNPTKEEVNGLTMKIDPEKTGNFNWDQLI